MAAFADASPALLLGDLNAPIEAPELAPLAGWTDGFAEPRWRRGPRLDRQTARGSTTCWRAARRSRLRVLREAGELSDHYPVVAEITTAGDRRHARRNRARYVIRRKRKAAPNR